MNLEPFTFSSSSFSHHMFFRFHFNLTCCVLVKELVRMSTFLFFTYPFVRVKIKNFSPIHPASLCLQRTQQKCTQMHTPIRPMLFRKLKRHRTLNTSSQVATCIPLPIPLPSSPPFNICKQTPHSALHKRNLFHLQPLVAWFNSTKTHSSN